jgi:asparagine synthase (glutamine-hydrolysing)
MCGIAACVGGEAVEATRAVAAMCELMLARGPDHGGVESLETPTGQVVLGARRLAIIDPSPAGHQPMRDDERGTVIAYNGMVYNYRELRRELEAAGERFSSDCDTEVVLRAYGHWGEHCVVRLRGMFAFAIWDGRDQSLFLARDRLGIKPLYYTGGGRRPLLVASQVKALVAAMPATPRLSRSGIESYLSYGAVSEPGTAFEDVHALPAGHVAVVRDGGVTPRRYWSPPEHERREPADAGFELRRLLEETVARHLTSDAPIGVFLSGGLDSSLLAALAQRTSNDVRTASVVFDDDLSESRWSDLVARTIRSDHVRVDLTAIDLLSWLPDAFHAMDQPTFDGINTFVVSRAAAGSGLKVALSGLGADELFDGYGYVRRVRLLQALRRVPPFALRAAGPSIRLAVGGRPDKVAYWLSADARETSGYALLRRLFLPPDVERLVGGTNGGADIVAAVDGDLYRHVTTLDLLNYTKNVLLRDTDAMSMGNSLEVRVPYLDDNIVEWSLTLPARVKGQAKALLLKAASSLLPREVLTRRKQGFVLPFGTWIEGPLRTEVDETLRNPPAALADVLDPAAVHDLWLSRAATDGWTRSWSLYALCRWADTIGARA